MKKTRAGPNGQMPEAPIGKGGKKDDTSCVVAEVVEWTEAHSKSWTPPRRSFEWQNVLGTFFAFDNCCAANYESDEEVDTRSPRNEPVPGVTSGPALVPDASSYTSCGNASPRDANSQHQAWHPIAAPAPIAGRAPLPGQWPQQQPNIAGAQPWTAQSQAYSQPCGQNNPRLGMHPSYGLPSTTSWQPARVTTDA